MRSSSRILALLVCWLLVSPVFGQQASSSTAPVVRDPQALALIQKAIQGLGGISFYSQTNGVAAQGTLNAAAGAISGPIVWEWAGAEFRYQRPGANGAVVFVSGHGNPALSDSGKVRRGIGHLAMVTFPIHLPAVALAASLNNPNVSISSIQSVSINGVNALMISFVDQTDLLSSAICHQTWYFDPTTFVPFRVDYLTSDANDALNTVQEYSLLSNYHNVSGVSVPFHIVTFFNGQQVEDVALTSVQLGASIPSTDFEPPVSVSGGAL